MNKNSGDQAISCQMKKQICCIGTGVLILVSIMMLIFYPSILQNKKYGLVPLEQSKAMDENAYQVLRENMPDYSIFSMKNNLDFNADYVNLHLPKLQTQNKALSRNRIPAYDESRILGLSLLGHPLADPFNPLNFFFSSFEPGHTILLKNISYLLLGLIFYIVLIFKLNITNNIWLVISGAFLYVLMPNSIYYLHWDNYIGLTMVLPLIFIGIVDLFKKNWPAALLYLTAAGSFSFLFNMFELFCYSIIFTTIFFTALALKEVRSFKDIGLVVGLIFVAASLIILISFPQISYSIEYLSELTRSGHFNWDVYVKRQAYYPKHESQLLGLLGFPVIWKTQHNIFANLAIIFSIVVALTNYKKLSNVMKAISVTFLCSFVFLFVGFIDLPLQLFNFYNLFANQIRSLYILTFLGSILFIYGCDTLLFEKETISWGFLRNNLSKVLAIMVLLHVVIILYFYLGLNVFHFSSRLSWYQDLLNQNYYLLAIIATPIFMLILWSNIQNHYYARRLLICIPLCIIAPLLIFAKMTVPFYSDDDVLSLQVNNHKSFSTRAILIDQKNEAKCPNCWQKDLGTILWSMGEVPITGYDTGIKGKTTEIFREFWKDEDYNTLALNPRFSWIHWQDYWIPPTSKKLITRNAKGSFIQSNMIKKMQILGVSRIYTNYQLSNLDIKDRFYNMDLYDLGFETPFSIVSNCEIVDIERSILNSESFAQNDCIINDVSYNQISFNDGLPQFHMQNQLAFLVIPYDFPGSFYLLDQDSNIRLAESGATGFYIVDLKEHNNLGINFDHESLWNKIKVALLGLFLLIIMFFLLRRLYVKT
ncbi:MAG: hypothetical protein HON23_07530 [Rickettsiales bacterium]|jgi:hypothetical protein|nr:hypothetical protein [Rickettsiales bacterium]